MNEVTLHARGHEHVSAAHESTFELTTDDWLTPAGDCIVGVDADTAPADLPDAFVEACQDEAAIITATLTVDGVDQRSAGSRASPADGVEETVTGRGDPDLTFDGERSLVFRTSGYVDERTVMVDASAAAADLDRDLVDALEDEAALTVTLRVE